MKCLVFHKPYEVLSQFTDARGRRNLSDYIPIPGVYAAGRLDYRSEGLLLLSDDGWLIHLLTDPRFEHQKVYFVQVEGIVSAEAVQGLNEQIVLPDIQTRIPQVEIVADPCFPTRHKPVRDYHPTNWLKVTLSEGKKHQVRQMTAAVGYPTLRLVRVAVGLITLGNLKPGDWRYLSQDELSSLLASLR